MFYVRENWSGRFRERLTRAILQVPHNMQRRITPRLDWPTRSCRSLKSIGGLLHRTPLATGISGYNKNWGYDSRRGSNESLNTHYQRKHDVPLATKQPAVRGSAGRKTGTMLL